MIYGEVYITIETIKKRTERLKWLSFCKYQKTKH